MKFEITSKEAQIAELAQCYSDYREVKKEIREAGGISRVSESLLDTLYWEARYLKKIQKDMGIEMVPEKDLIRDTKVFSRLDEIKEYFKPSTN